ncbi:MAG: 30S ribosomal protein S3 [Patescibacteria group bacterium]|nr:30S ribosomal protein S3 [Patescibacteria group bacterium]
MGHKANPYGFRLGVNKEWRSLWYAKKNLGKYLAEDKKIRDSLTEKIGRAGLSDVKIERSPNLKITVSVGRPGMVIGRGGAGLAELQEFLTKKVGSKVDIVVSEVRNPELSARLVGEEIVRSILRRIQVKRIMHQMAEKVMGRGAKGVKIIVSGVIGGPSSIHRTEKIIRGSIPGQTLRSNIDFARNTAYTSYGTLGIKVWIYLGETGS